MLSVCFCCVRIAFLLIMKILINSKSLLKMAYIDAIQYFMHTQYRKSILVMEHNCPLSAVFMFIANGAFFLTSANSIIIVGNLFARLASQRARYMYIHAFYIAGDIFILIRLLKFLRSCVFICS